MSAKNIFLDFLKQEDYRILLSLGCCKLTESPLWEGEYSIVFKASLNEKDIAATFFMFDGQKPDRDKWIDRFKRRFLTISLLETKNNSIQFVDYDILHLQDLDVPVLLMRLSPSLMQYNQILERSLISDEFEQSYGGDEILAFSPSPVEHEPAELMQEFTLIGRKNFPKELPSFVHCSDQKKIMKFFADFVAKKDLFDGKLVYFTDEERKTFSPAISKDGLYKFDNHTQCKVLDIWVYSDSELRNDYILVHHANTLPEKVNGKNTYRWAVYQDSLSITWEEAMNGFAEIDGEIVPLDQTKIEFFNRIPHEGYVFIALNNIHSLIDPANKGILRDYYFRSNFSYVNRCILEDLNEQIQRKTRNFQKKK